jgi:MFS family permease
MHDRNPEIRTDIPFRLDQLLFDTVGRKMIAGTFALGGALLFATANLFGKGMLTATTQTMAWSAIFFFAFAASSSAYLTASEIFPLETRALAIACFYALGTAIGGSLSPALFGRLIESESAWYVSFGYMIAALLMLFTDSSTGWLQVSLRNGIPDLRSRATDFDSVGVVVSIQRTFACRAETIFRFLPRRPSSPTKLP